MRGAPDGEERLLDGVLGERGVAQHAQREPIGHASVAVVERGERGLLAAGGEGDQRFVGEVDDVGRHAAATWRSRAGPR